MSLFDKIKYNLKRLGIRFKYNKNRIWRIWSGIIKKLKNINTNKSIKLRIGSISREGKIDNSNYLSIICDLLNIFPNTEFVLSGRHVRESTLDYFKKFNLIYHNATTL